jgi:hypothetical protein
MVVAHFTAAVVHMGPWSEAGILVAAAVPGEGTVVRAQARVAEAGGVGIVVEVAEARPQAVAVAAGATEGAAAGPDLQMVG